MRHWRTTWYSLIGPLMIWVAFIIVTPFFGVAAIASLGVLPLLGETALKAIGMFCVLILAPLAALAEIAPPIVTREEVRWRNRNSETLFEGAEIWEDIAFLPPILNRIRSTKGKRRQQADERDTAANARTVST
ncbi:hypothetical protein F3P66_26465 (plasmid) [Agrobacterium fabrum]|uniref:Uncharacterized protein n=3 Tax=Agrobacterium tumefaciens complex TaxID=1183400 RepID=A9CKV1_AGRFC|nr:MULTISPECIES: hypothetical protein [Agrobacterium]AAK91087.1 conserved hypothetical protein [Agrobacterium fabrum str. C58]ASK42303.1 hypothetical protein [Agrobacterium sp.]ASK42657.1 hypothetical protein [Agrobacterium fabrum str. C58]ASK43328.1 hypothetical protein [Agrobacterium fabrum]ASK45397.1 hypothetical protein [Agrobacterium tumefaciens]